MSLVLTSYRLWIPGSGSSFPQVPTLGAAVSASYVWDYLGLCILVISLATCAGFSVASLKFNTSSCSGSDSEESPKTTWLTQVGSRIWWCVILSGLILVILNQHRLQAWFYHLLIFSLIFTLNNSVQQLKWLRRIVISVYVYSALGKLDFEFTHTVGQDFLQAIATLFSFSITDWSDNDRVVITLLFPLIELAVGIGLVFQRTQRLAGVAAFTFHLVLAILVFGPLKHSWGVFLWNVQFAIQAILLFSWPTTVQAAKWSLFTGSSKTNSKQSWHTKFVTVLLTAALVLPLGERLGYWDHWPSWGLYAPHSSRVRVTIAKFAVKQLPDSLRRILNEDELEEAEIELPLARWSFRELGVPIYPQARFQLAVARQLCEGIESEFAIRAEIRLSADRFTGERKVIILSGTNAIQQPAGNFWLSSRPRR